jgi:hypothetical protein
MDTSAQTISHLRILDPRSTPSEPPREISVASAMTASSISRHWEEVPDEQTAFSHIIDAYRLRCEDEYSMGGDTEAIYNEDKPMPDFKRFLNKPEKTRHLLPASRKKEKRLLYETRVRLDKW